jgi:glycosyltransferase involved in cell wall biosynthesis
VLITVVPEVTMQSDLSNLLHRLAFYLGHQWPDRISIGVGRASVAPTLEGCELPPGFDPIAAQRLAAIGSVIDLIGGRSVLERRAAESDVVLLWDRDRLATSRWRRVLDGLPSTTRIVGVDLHHDRMEGSLYIQVGFDSSSRVEEIGARSRQRFAQLAERLGGAERAYLLATGPSIDHHADHDFTDGVVVACNTTVLDDALIDHAEPDIVTFADPIFHFGCSNYAATFRTELRRQAGRHEFTIVIPLKYHELFASLCPELEERTIGVPFGGMRPNLRLDVEFEVPPIDNIATLLMLPIACTLAKDVYMLGFDGRGRSETYFWQHSRRAQLHDLLPAIRGVHPSFFDTDYDEYYDAHSSTLERYLLAGEQSGHSFASLAETYIPALRRRTVRLEESSYLEALSPGASYRLVSLNPDLEDEFGHYQLYDAAIRKAAAHDGGDVVTLSSTAFVSEEPWIVPAFTDNSWSVRRDSPEVHIARFRDEFRNAYELIAKHADQVPTAIYLYVGSERHLVEMADVVARLGPRIPILVNLFYSHRDLYEVEHRTAGPAVGMGLALTRSFREGLGVYAFVDSDGLQRLMARFFEEDLPLWPMFSVSSIGPTTSEKTSAGAMNRALTVYAPGNLQFAKGYDLVSELSERLARHPDRHGITLIARSYFRHGTNNALRRHADKLAQHAKIIDGLLSDEEYAAAFSEADVILVPYRVSHFGTRTSAVISDAARSGKPVVATRGTWIGDVVERYDMGATFNDGDVADFEEAVWRVARHFDYYKSRAMDTSRRWDAEHNPRLLVDVMRSTMNKWAGSIEAPDPVVSLATVRSVFQTLSAYGVERPSASGGRSTPSDNADFALRRDLAKAREQLRHVKGSAAFVIATKAVAFLKKLGPFYRPIRSLARRIVGSR